ncbi:MAG: flagellar hook-basal body protein [Lawsonibacter sp.]|jgi:flagellar basal-body rod protein FlgG
MLQAFYNGALGAQQQMERMGVHGNNIANVNTNGYKAEKPAFGTLMYRMVEGAEGDQLPKGSGVRMISTATDFRAADLTQTGRDQDYAIVGEGFFALYDPTSQGITYTRDGAFSPALFQRENEDGELEEVLYLTDGNGRQVLDTQGYPIEVTDVSQSLPVGVFSIQYRDGLEHVGEGLFRMGEKNGAVWISSSPVRQGYLETSNTDLGSELGKVIETQRAYSYALRMVTTADEVETTVNNLIN